MKFELRRIGNSTAKLEMSWMTMIPAKRRTEPLRRKKLLRRIKPVRRRTNPAPDP
jgi:hypothetical protein